MRSHKVGHNWATTPPPQPLQTARFFFFFFYVVFALFLSFFDLSTPPTSQGISSHPSSHSRSDDFFHRALLHNPHIFPLEHRDSQLSLPDVQTTFSEEVAFCHRKWAHIRNRKWQMGQNHMPSAECIALWAIKMEEIHCSLIYGE